MVAGDVGVRHRVVPPGQELSLLHRRDRVSCGHRPGVNVRKYTRARSNSRAVRDPNARRNEHIGRNPRALTDRIGAVRTGVARSL
jgi:hypothetical protein